MEGVVHETKFSMDSRQVRLSAGVVTGGGEVQTPRDPRSQGKDRVETDHPGAMPSAEETSERPHNFKPVSSRLASSQDDLPRLRFRQTPNVQERSFLG